MKISKVFRYSTLFISLFVVFVAYLLIRVPFLEKITFTDLSAGKFTFDVSILGHRDKRVSDGERSLTFLSTAVHSVHVISAPAETSQLRILYSYGDSIESDILLLNKLNTGEYYIETNLKKAKSFEFFYLFSVCLGAFILASVLTSLIFFLKNILLFRNEVLVFSISFMVLASLAYLHYPGLISFDLANIYRSVLSGYPISFFGFFYCSLILSLLLIYPSPLLITLFNCGLFSILVSFFISKFRPKKWNFKIFVGLFFVLLMFFVPLNMLMQLYQSRDVTFTWLFILALLLLYKLFTDQKTTTKSIYFSIAVLCLTVCTLIRKDFIVIQFVLITYIVFKIPKSKFNSAVIIFSFITISGIYFGSPYLKRLTLDTNYELTAYVSPLINLIKDPKNVQPNSDDLIFLQEIVDLEAAKKIQTPFEIEPFHQGMFRLTKIDSSSVERIRKITFDMIINNFSAWLKLRWNLFSATAGFNGPVFLYADLYPSNFKDLVFPSLNYFPENELRPQIFRDLINQRELAKLILIPLIFCFITLLRFKKSPVTAVLSMAVILRLMIVFILAPASQYAYYLPVNYWGYLALYLSFLEYS